MNNYYRCSESENYGRVCAHNEDHAAGSCAEERVVCRPMGMPVFCEPIGKTCDKCGSPTDQWGDSLSNKDMCECGAHIENYQETMGEPCCKVQDALKIAKENGEPVVTMGFLPDTMTASVYESSVRAIISEGFFLSFSSIGEATAHVTAQIMELPSIRPDSALLTDLAQLRDEANETATWISEQILATDYELGRRAVYRVYAKALTALLKRHDHEA